MQPIKRHINDHYWNDFKLYTPISRWRNFPRKKTWSTPTYKVVKIINDIQWHTFQWNICRSRYEGDYLTCTDVLTFCSEALNTVRKNTKQHKWIHQNHRRYDRFRTFRFWAGQGSALSAGPQVEDRARARPPACARVRRPLLASKRARPVCSGARFSQSQSELLSMCARKGRENFKSEFGNVTREKTETKSILRWVTISLF